jgi:hypothetical protein
MPAGRRGPDRPAVSGHAGTRRSVIVRLADAFHSVASCRFQKGETTTPGSDDSLIVFRYPLILFVVSLAVLWLSAWIGASRFQQLRARLVDLKDEFSVVQGATLTLLGLIIGFTFSMALGRYDQRKSYEAQEANVIGTEYLRIDFLPDADAAQVRQLLRSYLDQRIQFYTTRDEQQLARIAAKTADLQAQLWAAVRTPAAAQLTPLLALVASGMNEVLDAQGYAQAAWWNRIPVAAWTLLAAIAMCAMILVGIGTGNRTPNLRILVISPIVVSIAFFLIADIDSPRRGVILVAPQNLLDLAQSLHAR